MVYNNLIANDFMSNLPIYIAENASLADVLGKIEEFGLSKITITNTRFEAISTISKKDIAQFLVAKNIRKDDPATKVIPVKTLLDYSKDAIVAYPDSNIENLYEVMDIFRIDYIPIVKNPWDKILIGFVPFMKLRTALEKAEAGRNRGRGFVGA